MSTLEKAVILPWFLYLLVSGFEQQTCNRIIPKWIIITGSLQSVSYSKHGYYFIQRSDQRAVWVKCMRNVPRYSKIRSDSEGCMGEMQAWGTYQGIQRADRRAPGPLHGRTCPQCWSCEHCSYTASCRLWRSAASPRDQSPAAPLCTWWHNTKQDIVTTQSKAVSQHKARQCHNAK